MKQRCSKITKSICSAVQSIRRNRFPWWKKKEGTIEHRRRFLGYHDERSLRLHIGWILDAIRRDKWNICILKNPEVKCQIDLEYLSHKKILSDMMDEWVMSCYDPDFLSRDDFEWKEQNFVNAINEALCFYAAVKSAECHYYPKFLYKRMTSQEKDIIMYEALRYFRQIEKRDGYNPMGCYHFLSDLPYEEGMMEVAWYFRYEDKKPNFEMVYHNVIKRQEYRATLRYKLMKFLLS